jgi:hypothetical protein
MRLDAARRRRVVVLGLALVSIAVVLAPTPARAQAFVTVRGQEPIPREGFKTWSLFLVTNQDWLVPENAQRLQQLYDRSQAFGWAIGKEHAAVWFWKKDARLPSPAIAENVDVERAVAYCKLLGRKPSEGPYLVFTTTYPDEHAAPSAYQVIALQGRSADDISKLFKELGNQLVLEGVVRNRTLQQPPESDDFWSAWFDATRHALAQLNSVACFVIRAPSFTIEAGCKPGGAS